MGENTKIEWCDHSASPWHGCAHATADGIFHPGCEHCYAETMSGRNPGTLGVWGNEGTRVKSKSFINNLRKWNREAKAAGKVVSVFPSLCDPFEDRPELVPWREEMFRTIDECQNLRLLLLTKRPQNVRRMWPSLPCVQCGSGECERHSPLSGHRENVWILASVSDQRTADVLVPDLLKCRELVPVLGLSVEPLLGPIDLGQAWEKHCEFDRSYFPPSNWEGTLNECPNCDDGRCPSGDDAYCCRECGGTCTVKGIDWVIVGGESGPHARPMHPDWARSIRDQCDAAGVAFFFKQWGEWICRPVDYDAENAHITCLLRDGSWTAYSHHPSDGWYTLGQSFWRKTGTIPDDTLEPHRVGKKLAGRLLDGVEHNAMPECEVPA